MEIMNMEIALFSPRLGSHFTVKMFMLVFCAFCSTYEWNRTCAQFQVVVDVGITCFRLVFTTLPSSGANGAFYCAGGEAFRRMRSLEAFDWIDKFAQSCSALEASLCLFWDASLSLAGGSGMWKHVVLKTLLLNLLLGILRISPKKTCNAISLRNPKVLAKLAQGD